MLAGNPGSFKSVVALNMMAYWARCGESCAYFSADSDEFTVAKRSSAILTGDAEPQVEANLARDENDVYRYPEQVERYTRALAALENVQFFYRTMDIDGIVRSLKTFEAFYGAYPSVVFLDNLMDYVEASTEWEQMRTLTRQLDVVARETKAHVVILHHTSESAVPAGIVPPSSAVQGKVTQKARLVLTVAATGLALNMCCVKNTNGPQDPSGRTTLQFVVHPSLRVEDINYRSEMRLAA
jgi:hypothetical protein